jgi:hypothetical protein
MCVWQTYNNTQIFVFLPSIISGAQHLEIYFVFFFLKKTNLNDFEIFQSGVMMSQNSPKIILLV